MFLDNLQHLLYQTYIQLMHRFCQYPELQRLLASERFSPQVRVLALGKAAWKMASLSIAQLALRGIAYDGFVLTKHHHSLGELPGLKILEAGHPLPDEHGLAASAQIVNWLRGIPAKDDLLILISGGSSALFEQLPEGLDLAGLSEIQKQLLKSGKSIAEMNRERSAHSLLKGGKALQMVKSKQVRIFAVSDVEGNDPAVLGSGPFTPALPGKKIPHGWHFELPKQQVNYRIVADNRLFCSQLASDLKQQGFKAHYEEAFLNSSVAAFADVLKEILRKAHSPHFRLRPPFVSVFGGETPLKVSGPGNGGRCSHLALSLVNVLAKHPNTALFCFATDGCDNISGSGGASVDSNSRKELLGAGINTSEAKKNYDSFTALKAIHRILPSPLLATNVNDVFVLCVGYDLENPFTPNSRDEYDLFEDLP